MKQKNYVKGFLKTGNGRRSALAAYDTKKVQTADQIALRNNNNPIVQGYMYKILNKAGLTDEKIAESLEAVVTAGVTRRSLRHAKPDDALRGIELAIKAKGLFPAEKKQVETRSLRLSLQSKSKEELQGMLNNLEKEFKDFRNVVRRTNELEA